MKGFCSILVILAILGLVQGDLKLGFYTSSCPKAEKIVQDYVNKHIPNAPSLAAALIRMNFHDCFVRGCDASILLNFTSASGNQTEKVAIPNQTGGPSWKVPTGRRDGLLSNASEALAQIPAPFNNITVLIQNFANKNLDVKDLVLLSAAHTIGISHCPSFSNRLYNFTGVGDRDPSLDSEYADNLRSRKCRTQNDNTTKVEMDPGSRSLQNFFSEFASSMVKMNQIEVKTGTSGEIRRNCAVVNREEAMKKERIKVEEKYMWAVVCGVREKVNSIYCCSFRLQGHSATESGGHIIKNHPVSQLFLGHCHPPIRGKGELKYLERHKVHMVGVLNHFSTNPPMLPLLNNSVAVQCHHYMSELIRFIYLLTDDKADKHTTILLELSQTHLHTAIFPSDDLLPMTDSVRLQHNITPSIPKVDLQVWRAALVLSDSVLHKMFTSSEFDGIVALELGAGT
ncbi:peroxidase 3-like protein, partial [Tanacetum coccineum]